MWSIVKFFMKSHKQLWCNINSPSSPRIINTSILSYKAASVRVWVCVCVGAPGPEQQWPNWCWCTLLCKRVCRMVHGAAFSCLLGDVAQRWYLSLVHILQKTGPGWCAREGIVAFEQEDPTPRTPTSAHAHTSSRESPIMWSFPLFQAAILILIRSRFENEIKCLVRSQPPATHCLWYHIMACDQDGEALVID